MEYAEKMYLVRQQQLDSLKHNETPPNLRQSAENYLDTAIKNVLSRTDMEQHEKAKLYTALLQRYLALVKQGALETNTLKLSLAQDQANTGLATPLITPVTNSGLDDDPKIVAILKNIPLRCKKNAMHILEKMLDSQDTACWTESGEFVFNKMIVPGTHIIDLVKSATAPQKIRHRPRGWVEFLSAMGMLNIPMSTVPNREVQQLVESLKRPATPSYVTPGRVLARTDLLSDDVDVSRWLKF